MSRTPVDAGRAGRRRPAFAVVLAAAVVAADQVTKHLAVEHLATGPVHLVGPLSLQLEYNTGVAFSLGSGSVLPVVLAVAAFVGVLAYFARGVRSTVVAAALGLVLGGALGNLADRFVDGRNGAVVDFIHLGFWPTFNLADASIVVGCFLLLLHSVRRRPVAPDPPASDGSGEPAPNAAGEAVLDGENRLDANGGPGTRDLERAAPAPDRR